jgi:hypothetical protein
LVKNCAGREPRQEFLPCHQLIGPGLLEFRPGNSDIKVLRPRQTERGLNINRIRHAVWCLGVRDAQAQGKDPEQTSDGPSDKDRDSHFAPFTVTG